MWGICLQVHILSTTIEKLLYTKFPPTSHPILLPPPPPPPPPALSIFCGCFRGEVLPGAMAVAVAPTTTHAHLSSQFSSSHVRLCASLWSTAGGGCGGEEESSRRGEVGLCSFSPWQGLLLCGNSQCSRLERQWCFAITRFCCSPVLRLGKSFTLLDCCCCFFFSFFWGLWLVFISSQTYWGRNKYSALSGCLPFRIGFFLPLFVAILYNSVDLANWAAAT